MITNVRRGIKFVYILLKDIYLNLVLALFKWICRRFAALFSFKRVIAVISVICFVFITGSIATYVGGYTGDLEFFREDLVMSHGPVGVVILQGLTTVAITLFIACVLFLFSFVILMLYCLALALYSVSSDVCSIARRKIKSIWEQTK